MRKMMSKKYDSRKVKRTSCSEYNRLIEDPWKNLLPEDLVYLNRQERRFLAAKKRKEDRKNK